MISKLYMNTLIPKYIDAVLSLLNVNKDFLNIYIDSIPKTDYIAYSTSNSIHFNVVGINYYCRKHNIFCIQQRYCVLLRIILHELMHIFQDQNTKSNDWDTKERTVDIKALQVLFEHLEYFRNTLEFDFEPTEDMVDLYESCTTDYKFDDNRVKTPV